MPQHLMLPPVSTLAKENPIRLIQPQCSDDDRVVRSDVRLLWEKVLLLHCRKARRPNWSRAKPLYTTPTSRFIRQGPPVRSQYRPPEIKDLASKAAPIRKRYGRVPTWRNNPASPRAHGRISACSHQKYGLPSALARSHIWGRTSRLAMAAAQALLTSRCSST